MSRLDEEHEQSLAERHELLDDACVEAARQHSEKYNRRLREGRR